MYCAYLIHVRRGPNLHSSDCWSCDVHNSSQFPPNSGRTLASSVGQRPSNFLMIVRIWSVVCIEVGEFEGVDLINSSSSFRISSRIVSSIPELPVTNQDRPMNLFDSEVVADAGLLGESKWSLLGSESRNDSTLCRRFEPKRSIAHRWNNILHKLGLQNSSESWLSKEKLISLNFELHSLTCCIAVAMRMLLQDTLYFMPACGQGRLVRMTYDERTPL